MAELLKHMTTDAESVDTRAGHVDEKIVGKMMQTAASCLKNMSERRLKAFE